jgi:hypothetical protein
MVGVLWGCTGLTVLLKVLCRGFASRWVMVINSTGRWDLRLRYAGIWGVGTAFPEMESPGDAFWLRSEKWESFRTLSTGVFAEVRRGFVMSFRAKQQGVLEGGGETVPDEGVSFRMLLEKVRRTRRGVSPRCTDTLLLLSDPVCSLEMRRCLIRVAQAGHPHAQGERPRGRCPRWRYPGGFPFGIGGG